MKPKWKSRINELLDAKGRMLGLDRAVTAEEAAKELGVSRQTVYAWMEDEGIQMLSAEKAARVARYFGVPVYSVWRLEENESEATR